TISLLDRDRIPHGRARLQLTVEAGDFFVATAGRLRAYSHRYVYTVGNMAVLDDPQNTLTQFTPLFCPTGAVLQPATISAGDGDDSGWSATIFVHGRISLAHCPTHRECVLISGRLTLH